MSETHVITSQTKIVGFISSDLVRQIISKENIEPKYIIGDRLSDSIAGIDNDIETIGCRFYFSKNDELKHASRTVNALAELKKIIK